MIDEPFDVRPGANGWSGVAYPLGGVELVGGGTWKITTIPSGGGVANLAPCYWKQFDAGTAEISALLLWSGAATNSTLSGFQPLIIQSPLNTMAEVILLPRDGGFAATLQCVSRLGVFIPCSSSAIFAQDQRHAIELSLADVNSASGFCRLAIDGRELCSQRLDWTGLAPNAAYIGLCAVDRGLSGDSVSDALRIVVGPQASQLRVRGLGGARLVGGSCAAFEITSIDTFSRARAPSYVPITATAGTNSAIVGTYADPNCALTQTTEWLVPPDGGAVHAYARLEDPFLTTQGQFNVNSVGSFGAFALFLVTPSLGVTDSGVTDSGVTDSGVTDSGVTDSGVTDSGVTDSGVTDSGVTDSGVPDSGVTDSGVADSGVADSGAADSGVADSGVTDSGVTDSGVVGSGFGDGGELTADDAGLERTPSAYSVSCGCSGTPNAMMLLLGLAALLVRRCWSRPL